jgi:hypothetical protein
VSREIRSLYPSSGERPSVYEEVKQNRTAAFGNLPAEGSTFWRLSLGLVVRMDLTLLSVLCGTVHYIIMVLVSHVCSSSLEPSPRLESTVPTLVTQVA